MFWYYDFRILFQAVFTIGRLLCSYIFFIKDVDKLKISNEAIVKSFWSYFDMGEYDEAAKLMAPEAVVQWCNTREIFRGRENFILANKKYPGARWRISVEKLLSVNDMIISVVKAECSEPELSFYATSFFKLQNELISEIVEYWGENGEPPEWRIKEGLSERY